MHLYDHIRIDKLRQEQRNFAERRSTRERNETWVHALCVFVPTLEFENSASCRNVARSSAHRWISISWFMRYSYSRNVSLNAKFGSGLALHSTLFPFAIGKTRNQYCLVRKVCINAIKCEMETLIGQTRINAITITYTFQKQFGRVLGPFPATFRWNIDDASRTQLGKHTI